MIDLYVAWTSGLCLGLLGGGSLMWWGLRNIEWRSIGRHSQEGEMSYMADELAYRDPWYRRLWHKLLGWAGVTV